MIQPPSGRVVYERLEDEHVIVRYLWCEPREHPLMAAIITAEGVRGRGESFEYDEAGRVVLSSSRGAEPPRTTPPGDDEWALFRKLAHLTGRVSPVLL